MTEDQLNPLRRECVRDDGPSGPTVPSGFPPAALVQQDGANRYWERSDDHEWQGLRSDGTPIGPYNDQASVDDVIRRERRAHASSAPAEDAA